MNDPRDTAAKALAKCAAYDPWFPNPNRATVEAWAEQIAHHHLDLPDVLAGVARMYGEAGHGFKPLPGDLVRAARAIRSERAEREPDEYRDARQRALEAKVADQAAALAESKTPTRFYRPSKAHGTNPLTVVCPFCRAGTGRRCTNTATGQPRHTAHPSRIAAAVNQAPNPGPATVTLGDG